MNYRATFEFFESGFHNFLLPLFHILRYIPGVNNKGSEPDNPLIINTMVCYDDSGIDSAK